MIDLSIIIISYNTKELTKKCIESVCASANKDKSLKAELIIFDNGSQDGSVQMLKNYKNKQSSKIKIEIIFSKNNLGFAKANNQAIDKTKAKNILFLNSDTEAIEDAVPRLFNYFTSKKNNFSFVGGKLFEKDAKTPQPSCGLYYSLPAIFTALFLRGDYLNITRSSPDKICQSDWVSGACFICKKKDFVRLNGFDEQIFMYMEEIDLFYRAGKKGLKIGFFPEAKFIHVGSGSSSNRSQPIIQVYKGFLYLYKKHHKLFQVRILKSMLKLKANIAILIGFIFNNPYLKQTYAKAKKIVQDN